MVVVLSNLGTRLVYFPVYDVRNITVSLQSQVVDDHIHPSVGHLGHNIRSTTYMTARRSVQSSDNSFSKLLWCVFQPGWCLIQGSQLGIRPSTEDAIL